jgi:hypothetical protein
MVKKAEMPDESKFQKVSGREHSLEFIEKGSRVVSHGNVNADKPPTGTGPVTKEIPPGQR